ncbi:MAG: hypothetical protein Tsb0020_45620 [Haliangiales bacterium]
MLHTKFAQTVTIQDILLTVGLTAALAATAACGDSSSASQVPDAGGPDATTADAGEPDSPVYFVVAEMNDDSDNNDSYVVPITDPDDVAHARALIADGPDAVGRPLVVAHVRSGADGINRDVRSSGEPLWSWHVVEFVNFADITLELYDGSPSLIEGDVDFWMGNTPPDEGSPDEDGTIGFWDYTVVEELPPQSPAAR